MVYFTFLCRIHPYTAKQAIERNISFAPTDTLTDYATHFEDDLSLVFSSNSITAPLASASSATPPSRHQSRITSRSQNTYRPTSLSPHRTSRPPQRSYCRQPHHSPSPYFCYYCKYRGHTMGQCYVLHQNSRYAPHFCDCHGDSEQTTTQKRVLSQQVSNSHASIASNTSPSR